MCQLLGMNCNTPTDICFSFEGFSARGGKTDIHGDGWGIAFFEGSGCRVFIDDKASAYSPIAEFIKHYPIHSLNVIAHIRKATHGPVCLENTQPFQRELWGRYWLFAHNGELENFSPPLPASICPVGETDSERAFCTILAGFFQEFPQSQPEIGSLHSMLQTVSDKIAGYGMFNYLLSNGETLFAYCATQLHYIIRQAPFKLAHLVDQDVSINFNELTSETDRVAVIATTPLTDNETWTAIPPGQLMTFKDGLPVNH